MKAMAIQSWAAPLVPVDAAAPVAGPGEVVLSVKACGVCRTDLKIISGKRPSAKTTTLPLIPGHEVAGVVETLGPGVTDWQVGDRAIVYFYLNCGDCPACRAGRDQLCTNLSGQIGFTVNGGYAEKVKVLARNLVRIPDSLPDAQAAIVPDAIGTAHHAVVDRAEVKVGDRVLVIGAGGVGIHVAQLVALSGAHTIVVDVDEKKLAKAEAVGVDEVYKVSGLDTLPKVRVNKVIEATGFLRDFKHVAPVMESGGLLCLVGYSLGDPLGMAATDLISPEYDIRGSRACAKRNVIAAVDLIARGKLESVIDSVHPLGEANEVLHSLETGVFNGRAVLVP